MSRLPKVVLAPMNIASMPVQIVKELRRRGFEAEQVQYSFGEGHKFGYELDREVNIRELGGRIRAHSATVKDYLERDFDIFHFWNKSFFYEGRYQHLTGFDIPIIKARQKRIAYRFTGFDVRLPSWDLEVNPYSPFRYGYKHLFNEEIQKAYLAFLSEHVDQFLVQDPELQQFSPRKPVVIPRALKLSDWEPVGVKKRARPLVVHAPSNDVCKGSKFVLEAIESLKDEGLKFDFKAIRGMAHSEAVSWYKKSDIIVDQLLIGATGVLTLEAMALGKPCVVYLREDLFKPFYKTNDLPVANANPDTIKDVLRKLIKDFEWREDLSVRGRKLVEEYHDIDHVIDQYENVYKAMMRKKPYTPKGYADLDYMRLHAEMSQRNAIVIKNKEKQLEETRLVEEVSTAVTPSEMITHLDGDEKLELLDKLLPGVVVTPIRVFVHGRRRVFRAGRAMKRLGTKFANRLYIRRS